VGCGRRAALIAAQLLSSAAMLRHLLRAVLHTLAGRGAREPAVRGGEAAHPPAAGRSGARGGGGGGRRGTAAAPHRRGRRSVLAMLSRRCSAGGPTRRRAARCDGILICACATPAHHARQPVQHAVHSSSESAVRVGSGPPARYGHVSVMRRLCGASRSPSRSQPRLQIRRSSSRRSRRPDHRRRRRRRR
jgi:hypothetical protein